MFSRLSELPKFLPVQAPESVDELDPRLRLYSDGRLDIWYSPMGEVTQNPKLWILGITPGWNQMKIAYSSAADMLNSGFSPDEANAAKKPQVAFAGSMRSNLVSMMDQIGFPETFGVDSSADLFGSSQLRTGSVLKYPVFRDRRNYTGSTPKPLSHPALLEMIDSVFMHELASAPDCLILPLGRSVERVLDYVASKTNLPASRVLTGFPHPSGANGHRQKHFERARKDLRRMVLGWSC